MAEETVAARVAAEPAPLLRPRVAAAQRRVVASVAARLDGGGGGARRGRALNLQHFSQRSYTPSDRRDPEIANYVVGGPRWHGGHASRSPTARPNSRCSPRPSSAPRSRSPRRPRRTPLHGRRRRRSRRSLRSPPRRPRGRSTCSRTCTTRRAACAARACGTIRGSASAKFTRRGASRATQPPRTSTARGGSPTRCTN